MAQQHKNETLEQQRKAREDFLALKKMQHGELDAGPKPSEVAVLPKTPAEKLKNIWFHDKWFIMGAIALAIVMVVCVAQCASRPKYDLSVVVYAYNFVGDDDCKLMADYLSQHCEDINGDGKVIVNVINCSYTEGSNEKQYIYSRNTKLQAVLSTDSSALLYITDKDSYEYLSALSESSLFEGEPLVLNEKFYKACDGEDLFALPEGLQISCRVIDGTVIEGDKKISSYYEQSRNILKGLSNSN